MYISIIYLVNSFTSRVIFSTCRNYLSIRPLLRSGCRIANFRGLSHSASDFRLGVGVVSNVLHETDLVSAAEVVRKLRYRLPRPAATDPPRVRPRRIIELGSGLFQANTQVIACCSSCSSFSIQSRIHARALRLTIPSLTRLRANCIY